MFAQCHCLVGNFAGISSGSPATFYLWVHLTLYYERMPSCTVSSADQDDDTDVVAYF